MASLLFNFGGLDQISESVCDFLDCSSGDYLHREFPDGESFIRVDSDVSGVDCIVVAQLHKPNSTVLPLLLFCETLKDLGARSIGLVCPYLAYMRQDIRFNPGEGITSRYFAALISQHFDWMVTVDPHLHRYDSLDEIYSIPTVCLTAVAPIADFVRDRIESPVIIGPDGESEQWAARVADRVGCPCDVLTKVRSGDKDVTISLPDAERYKGRVPVIVDDIISTGKTMMQAANHLSEAGLDKAVCIGVHSVFAPGAYEEMIERGYEVFTCNSICHESNVIDLGKLIAEAIKSHELGHYI